MTTLEDRIKEIYAHALSNLMPNGFSFANVEWLIAALRAEREKRVEALARYHRSNIGQFREMGENYAAFEKWATDQARAQIEAEDAKEQSP